MSNKLLLFVLAFCVLAAPDILSRLQISPRSNLPSETMTMPDRNVPLLFNAFLRSKYVVLATPFSTKLINKPYETKIIGKTKDGYLVAGADVGDGRVLYTFKVDEVLISNKLGEHAKTDQSAMPHEFRIFSDFQVSNERYSENQKYLIFLNTLPEIDRIVSEYSLRKDETLYRAVKDQASSVTPAGVHVLWASGRLSETHTDYSQTVARIKKFAKALEPSSDRKIIQRLQPLLSSSDKELVENADYAIKWLKAKSKAE